MHFHVVVMIEINISSHLCGDALQVATCATTRGVTVKWLDHINWVFFENFFERLPKPPPMIDNWEVSVCRKMLPKTSTTKLEKGETPLPWLSELLRGFCYDECWYMIVRQTRSFLFSNGVFCEGAGMTEFSVNPLKCSLHVMMKRHSHVGQLCEQ